MCIDKVEYKIYFILIKKKLYFFNDKLIFNFQNFKLVRAEQISKNY